MSDARAGADREIGAEWEALALRIHRCRTASGRAVAVFGADHCQRCAALTPFATVAEAKAVHLGPDGDRVCADCLRREGRDGALAALAESAARVCEGCGEAVARDPARRVGGTWMCAACTAAMGAEPHRARGVVLALLRRRYLLLGFPSLAELQVLARVVRAMRARGDAADAGPVALDA